MKSRKFFPSKFRNPAAWYSA